MTNDRLIYEDVKGALDLQLRNMWALDTKLSVLFAASTAIVGIGVSIGLIETPNTHPQLAVLAAPAAITYALLLYFFVRGMWPKEIITSDNPNKIRKNFNNLTDTAFYAKMLDDICLDYTYNKGRIDGKASSTKWVAFLLFLEALTLILWIAPVSVWARGG